MKLQAIIRDREEKFPNKSAIIFKDRNITFRDLKDITFRVANYLIKNGIKRGDRVAIFLPNYPEYVFSYLAIFSIGAVAVPLDFMLTEIEIKDFINHSESHVLIAMSRKDVDIKKIKKECSSLDKVVLLQPLNEGLQDGEFLSWQEALKESPDLPDQEIEENDPSSIFYTSGSTGHPKGVLLNYSHFDNPIDCISRFLHPTDKDSYLCAGVPFSHIGGLDYMLFMLYFGSTMILMDRFHPLESLKNLQKYKPTIFCIVPAMFVAILSMKDVEKFDLSSLIHPVVFGAPSSPELLKKFQKLCPNACLRNGWGMTETAAPNSYSPADINKINSIGNFGGTMQTKIVDDKGCEVKNGERGELWLKGKAVMVAYYKEEELTRNVFTDDGWFKTGDIAIKDDEGLHYIVGRKKDLIKVGGEIVFAHEVESVLYRHPQIQEAAVFGVPDKLRGEVPKAFVVVKQNEVLNEEDVRYFAKEHLAHFKIPHVIEFKDSLPKNRTGKVDKELLKEELAQAA